MFSWKRYGGYEISTQGDKRFSAMVATLEDGRTIEMHYQCDIKGYDPGGRNWRLGKGMPPLKYMTLEEQFTAYMTLWLRWATQNPKLLHELYERALEHDKVLSDRFATTPINQAHALSTLLNIVEEDLKSL